LLGIPPCPSGPRPEPGSSGQAVIVQTTPKVSAYFRKFVRLSKGEIAHA
jgi:hypothetical protein